MPKQQPKVPIADGTQDDWSALAGRGPRTGPRGSRAPRLLGFGFVALMALVPLPGASPVAAAPPSPAAPGEQLQLVAAGAWIDTPCGRHRRHAVHWCSVPLLATHVYEHQSVAGNALGYTAPAAVSAWLAGQPVASAIPGGLSAAAAMELARRQQARALARAPGGSARAPVVDEAAAVESGWIVQAGTLVWGHAVTLGAGLRPAEARLLLGGDGRLLARQPLAQRAVGQGLVFDPNPVVVSGDRSLRDGDDVDLFRSAVRLRDLDGSGGLRGLWAAVHNPGGDAYATDLEFSFSHRARHFEEVMAFYHVTEAQRYLRMLGYTALNARPQQVCVHATANDDSWYSPASRCIYLGDGGVDDGEDADIILHEYGHAVFHDVVGAPIGGDARALSEGFSDYLAATRTGDSRIGDWDGVALSGGCWRDLAPLRRAPEDVTGEPHSDGLIWGSLLWRLREALGARLADIAACETLYYLTPAATFAHAAEALTQVAARMEAAGLGHGVIAVTEDLLSAAGLRPAGGSFVLPAAAAARTIPWYGGVSLPGLTGVTQAADSLRLQADGSVTWLSGDSDPDAPQPCFAALARRPGTATWYDTLQIDWRHDEAGLRLRQTFIDAGTVRREATLRLETDGSLEIGWGGAGSAEPTPGWAGWLPGGRTGATDWIDPRETRVWHQAALRGTGLAIDPVEFAWRGAVWRFEPAPAGYDACLVRRPTPAPPAQATLRLVPAISRDATRAVFETDLAGDYELTLYDAAGRLLRPRQRQHLAAGRHGWPIALPLGPGSAPANGLVFVRLEGPQGTRVGRWLLLPGVTR